MEFNTEIDSCWGWFGVWDWDKLIVLEAIHTPDDMENEKWEKVYHTPLQ